MSPLRSSTLCAAALAVTVSTLGSAAGAPAAPEDARHAMIAVLEAPGPHASLGAEAKLFDRFVGAWDADFTAIAEDGSVSRYAGELLFGWVLDGRAMQDIWIVYPQDGAGAERRIGTTVRIFDPQARTWRVVWLSASFGVVSQLEGGAEGDRIVLRGRESDGTTVRWSFNDIRSDSFVWRGEVSQDGGATWQLREEHQMRRRAAVTAAAAPGSGAGPASSAAGAG